MLFQDSFHMQTRYHEFAGCSHKIILTPGFIYIYIYVYIYIYEDTVTIRSSRCVLCLFKQTFKYTYLNLECVNRYLLTSIHDLNTTQQFGSWMHHTASSRYTDRYLPRSAPHDARPPGLSQRWTPKQDAKPSETTQQHGTRKMQPGPRMAPASW